MIPDLTCGACISVRSVDPPYVRIFLEERGVKLDIYEHLLRINAGYDQAIRSLAALRKHGAFHRSTLERFTALSKETRAATNSYLVGAIETAETDEAGRRFRDRRLQE